MGVHCPSPTVRYRTAHHITVTCCYAGIMLRPSFFPSLGCREQREVSTIKIAHLVAKSLKNQVAVFDVLART